MVEVLFVVTVVLPQ